MSVIRQNLNNSRRRNSPSIVDTSAGQMTDFFPESSGNSPYDRAKRLFSTLSDRTWIDRLDSIANSYVEPSQSIFDKLGLSQNYDRSVQAQLVAINKEITNLMAEYQAHRNSLPQTQREQLEAAGLNPAITGGISGSDLAGNQSNVPDPIAAPFESPMATMASVFGGFSDVFGAASSILGLLQQGKSIRIEGERLDEDKRQFNLSYINALVGLSNRKEELSQGKERLDLDRDMAEVNKSKSEFSKAAQFAQIQTAFAEAGMDVPDSFDSIPQILSASKNKALAAAKVKSALSEANVDSFEASARENYVMSHQEDLAEAIEDIARLAYLDKILSVSASISSSRYSMDSDKTGMGENKVIRAGQKGRLSDAEDYSSTEASTLRKMLVRAGIRSDISEEDLSKLRDDSYYEALSKWRAKSKKGNPFASWMYSKFLFGQEPWSAGADAVKKIAVGAGAAAAGMGIGAGGASAAAAGAGAVKGFSAPTSTLF